MKLLVDCHEFDKSHQGTTVYTKNLFSRLAKERKEIDFYFCARDIDNLKSVFGKEHNFIQLKSKNIVGRLLFEYPRIIKNYNIDYCHFNYVIPFIKYKSSRYLVTIHDVLFLDFKNLFSWKYIIPRAILFRRAAKLSDKVFTVSEYSKQRIVRNFKIKDDKITVLVNGINHMIQSKIDNTLLPEGIKENQYILSVGRLESRKNHELLFDIFCEEKYYKQNIKLVFIGSNAFIKPSFQKKIDNLKNLDLKESVIFLRDLSNEELVSLYKNSLVHVYISKCEGFGIPPIESAVLGVKTICSNVTAMSDFDFFKKLHVDPEDKEKIKIILTKILNHNTKEFENDVEQAKIVIRDKYDWDKSVRILSSFIN